MSHEPDPPDTPASDPAPLAPLVDHQRAFLAFLTRRLGDRTLAEDVLHDAFVKLAEHPDRAPADEGIVPWFYRTLRNAAIDRLRRQGSAQRALDAFARELEAGPAVDDDTTAEICECVSRLAATLKPEYADALAAVDLQGRPVKEFAVAHGISASNAGVRIFRARAALKRRVVEACGVCAEHGCRNCTCRGEV